MIWDARTTVSPEELTKMTLGFLLIELSIDRVAILMRGPGSEPFDVVAHRHLEPSHLWDGKQLDLRLIYQVDRSGQSRCTSLGDRAIVCAPLLDLDHPGPSLGLVYADRPMAEHEFSSIELNQLQIFLQSVATRWGQLQRPPVRQLAFESSSPRRSARPLSSMRLAVDQPTTLQKRRVTARRNVAGRFVLADRPLLEGRFSTLYEGLDRLKVSPIVLRKLGDGEASRDVRQQTLREGRHLARLVHRNLPRVQEIVEHAGQVYLVLEEFSGTTLAQAGKCNAERLESTFEQLLDVLAYLHQQDPPIIHRDLRPDTILVTDHGVLKVAEFGLARLRDGRSDPRETAFRSAGNPHYAPPEQIMGEASQPYHDLYAVGAILYFLATGQAPPRSMERYSGWAQLEPLADLRPDLPLGLTSAITALMAPDCQNRPATVEAARRLRDQEVPSTLA